jgi:hypothetical protein
LLASRIHRGTRLRICIGEQETPSARATSALQGDSGTTCCGDAVLALVSELWPHGSVTVRVCGGVVYNTICRADNELLAAQHAYGIDPRRGSVILLNNVGAAGMFAAYTGSFDRAWATARPVM